MYDPNANYVQSMADCLKASFDNIFARMYPNLTVNQQYALKQAFSNNLSNLTNGIIRIQQQRGNIQLTSADVDQYIQSFINQALMQNTMPMMPAMPQAQPYPMMGGYGGIGMNTGLTAFQRPMMSGYGMNAMAPIAPMSPQIQVPSFTQTEMANMYGIKPDQPPLQNVQKPIATPNAIPTPIPQAPAVSTIPEVKVTTAIATYQEPKKVESKSIRRDGLIDSGDKIIWEDQFHNKIYEFRIALRHPVKYVSSVLDRLISRFSPTVLRLKYLKYNIIDIPFEELNNTLSEIKTTIQNAKASTEDVYTNDQYIEMIIKILDNKSKGLSRTIEQIIVGAYNLYMHTINLGGGAYKAGCLEEIIEHLNSAPNNDILAVIDRIVSVVIDTNLMESYVCDAASEECAAYLGDELTDDGLTYSELKKADTEAFESWAKSVSVLVSEPKNVVWTICQFSDMVDQQAGDPFDVHSKPVEIDNSPKDSDLEHFIKDTDADAFKIGKLIVDIENVTINYSMANNNGIWCLRKIGRL